MKIISLQAEAFKRLTAVEVNPGGHIVELTGENGEGKSSTLDAIWAALGGASAAPAKPIHTGEKKAEVRLILGEDGKPHLKVTRRFKLKEGGGAGTDLIVENAEGARYQSPQAVLDALVGSLCFDPLAFMRLKDEEQIKNLRRFVPDVDFEQIEGLNRRDYDARTEVNRRVRDLKGQLAALPEVAGDVPEPVDIASLENQLANAASHNSEVETRAARRRAAQERVAAIQAEIARLTEEMTKLQADLTAAPALPELVDIAALRQKLATGRESNALIAKAAQRKELEERIAAGAEEEVRLSAAIDKRKADAAEAVQKAAMPVPGLGFGDNFVTLNGEPLAQASQAEKIRVGVAIAAAMNPKLRVARIADGSLLDKKSWAILGDYAQKHDLQIWVETVEQKGEAAVLISNGSTAQPAAKVAEDVL